MSVVSFWHSNMSGFASTCTILQDFSRTQYDFIICDIKHRILISGVTSIFWPPCKKEQRASGPREKMFCIFVLNILYRPILLQCYFIHGLQLAVTGRYVYFHLTYQFSLCQQQKLQHEMTKQFLKNRSLTCVYSLQVRFDSESASERFSAGFRICKVVDIWSVSSDSADCASMLNDATSQSILIHRAACYVSNF